MSDEEEILEEFILECHEHLNQVENNLISIEHAVKEGRAFDEDEINHLFRAIHSVKGGSGCLGLQTIANLTHAQENVLDNVRKGRIELNIDIVSILLKSIDKLVMIN